MASPTTTEKEGLSIFTVFVSLLSICIAVAAIIVAATAGDGDDGASSASAGSTVTVSLTEFAIDPDPISVGAGGTLAVVNDGTMAHNLAVKDGDLSTPDLAAGETGSLELGDLAPGEHTVICTVAGHEDSGMTATIIYGERG